MNEWMQTAFADHLDSARCSALITEEDLAAGVVALGGSLALLQRDLAALSGCQRELSSAVDVNADVNALEFWPFANL